MDRVSAMLKSRSISTIFVRLSAHDRIGERAYFSRLEGNGQPICHEKRVKPPPRSKKSEITYLSSCYACKPALNSAILAVPSCSHCSYSLYGRTIDQLTIFSHAGLLRQASRHAEQREREGAITTRCYNRQSLRCAVKRKIAGNPSTENLPNLYLHSAANRKNTVYSIICCMCAKGGITITTYISL